MFALLGLWRFAKPFLPQIMIGLALLFGVWMIHHKGVMAERARQEARQAHERLEAEQRARRIETALREAVGAIDSRLGDRLEALQSIRTTIVQPMQKEIQVETRYRDPQCSLTRGVLDNLNRAIDASNPIASGSGEVTVPIPAQTP